MLNTNPRPIFNTDDNESSIIITIFRPRGKENTEIRKSQIKEKKSENSYQELKRSQKGQAHTAVPVEISRFSFRVFVYACSSRDLFNSW